MTTQTTQTNWAPLTETTDCKLLAADGETILAFGEVLYQTLDGSYFGVRLQGEAQVHEWSDTQVGYCEESDY